MRPAAVRTHDPPSGPGRYPAGPSLVMGPRNAASWPIRARFTPLYSKVSQNREVSPKYHEKASHSPYFQNGRQKSPLEILRFPFPRAFSHKELMAHFDGAMDFIVKMTKCRQSVHARYPQEQSREGCARYPHDTRSKLLLGVAPHLAWRGILNEVTFRRFAPDYD